MISFHVRSTPDPKHINPVCRAAEIFKAIVHTSCNYIALLTQNYDQQYGQKNGPHTTDLDFPHLYVKKIMHHVNYKIYYSDFVNMGSLYDSESR